MTTVNREDPHGYMLSTVEFDNGEPTAPQNSTDALTHIISMTSTENCPDNCFRPVGLVWDSQGRLFVTSDTTGEIFILERQEGTPTSTESGSLVQPEKTGTPNNDDDSAASGVAAHSLIVVAIAFGVAMFIDF